MKKRKYGAHGQTIFLLNDKGGYAEIVATAKSGTLAKRIANALNIYIPKRRKRAARV
jgi:hypothetical protein